ncbi:MAG: NADH-quinone oxidoreductase subunit [Gammaproteobacteria bacterium]|jgi:NADH-quinone oxidoreductase subunit A|nr:NADH-quinone oxidoreductase subunit [Gammaproteobacteria bacterium]
MLTNYLPILIFIIIGLLFGAVAIVASKVVAKFTKVNRPDPAKLSPFECGFGEFEDARMRFDVRYYLVAILFIVFDLEIAFLFPWSVVMTKIGWLGFAAMGLFLFLLVVGFIYEWKKGALEWE